MQVIDYDMPYQQFLEAFEGVHAEWVDGVVYQLPRCSQSHTAIHKLMHQIITGYLKKYPEGQCISAPNVLRVNNVEVARCPDMQILLNQNTQLIHGREVSGAADIVIEIISECDHKEERGDKFVEYEQGGVGEYWIIDPVRQECLFYSLESGYFRRQDTDLEGVYHSKRLKNFCLPIPFLWSNPSDDKINELINTL